jgi:hypothetical protein
MAQIRTRIRTLKPAPTTPCHSLCKFPLFTLTLSSTQRNGNDTIAEQLVERLDLGVDLFAQFRDGAKHGVARQPAAARLGALGLARLEQVLRAGNISRGRITSGRTLTCQCG